MQPQVPQNASRRPLAALRETSRAEKMLLMALDGSLKIQDSFQSKEIHLSPYWPVLKKSQDSFQQQGVLDLGSTETESAELRSDLFSSDLVCSALVYSALFCSSPLQFMLICFILLYFALICLICSHLLYCALPSCAELIK